MTKLIVSCDGTWNSPEQRQYDVAAPTNVVRLHNSVAKTDVNGVEQKRYYISGVGSDGSWLERISGGAYGKGTSRIIMDGYAWLLRQYNPGDEIYVFGFSRGAFSARSLAGFVGCCGLPDVTALSPDELAEWISHCYTKVYMVEKARRPPVPWPKKIEPVAERKQVPIQFIGVWDTVGALGVPDDLGVLDLFDDATKWAFHDTLLGRHVRYARHAIAIDEMRSSFTPTLWTDEGGRPIYEADDLVTLPRIRQLWFPGAHRDVGGGYSDCRLSDGALLWMIEEARRAGLAFAPAFVQQMQPHFQGLLHDSNEGGFKLLESRPRNRPLLTPNSVRYHTSAWQREAAPPITQTPYHGAAVCLQVGQTSEPIDIHARNPWNETGLFLEADASYSFAAEGEWLDKNIPCGPAGMRDGKFRFGEMAHLVGSAIGKVESLANNVRGKPGTDYPLTRRHEQMPWFSLVGAIANDGGAQGFTPGPDGTTQPHQSFLIGDGSPAQRAMRIQPDHEGYLYAYANDAWHFYGNNSGSVQLRVTRLT